MQDDNILERQTVIKLLDIIYPGSKLNAILPFDGSYSNYTNLVEFTSANGMTLKIVVRRYKVFGHYDRGEKAKREYSALEYTRINNIPTPYNILLDQTGEILGIPGIVTAYIDGKSDLNPSDPDQWASKMAITLAKIHSLPPEIPEGSFVLDANSEALWFIREDEPPDFMRRHPSGIEVWHAAKAIKDKYVAPTPHLVHIDYWPGNILWKDGEIVAVIDWEEAAYGDPVIDVGYARMEMSIMGFGDAMEAFLDVYQSHTNADLDNLVLWELAAIARPMYSPETWNIIDSQRKLNYDRFVTSVLEKIS